MPRSSPWAARGFAASTLFFWAALYVYVPILPVYAQSLGASLEVVGLVVSAYGFSQLILRIPVGLASDRLGRRKLLCGAGYLIGGLACAALLLAPSPTWLVAGRAVAGIAAAFWVVISVTYSDYWPSDQLPRAMALLTALSGLAQLLSTSAGGWLADTLGWSAPFVAGIALSAAGTILLTGVPEPRKARSLPLTWSRALQVGRNRHLLRVALVAALFEFAFWATTYTFVPVWASNLGASRTTLGLLTSVTLVAYTIAAFGVSRWVTPRRATRFALAGLVICALTAAIVPAIHQIALLEGSQALGGLGRGLAMSVLIGMSIQKAEPDEKATAMGVFQAIYAVGMFLGPASAGFVAQALGPSGAFVLSAAMCIVAAVVLLV
jgi:predicted MFS family arabinose efflux permease